MRLLARRDTLVFPTRVGMNRGGRVGGISGISVPHASGDEPQTWSPGRADAQVFPTRVGMNRPPVATPIV